MSLVVMRRYLKACKHVTAHNGERKVPTMGSTVLGTKTSDVALFFAIATCKAIMHEAYVL